MKRMTSRHVSSRVILMGAMTLVLVSVLALAGSFGRTSIDAATASAAEYQYGGPSSLEEIYAALRPANLVTTTGETAFQQGEPINFRWNLINTSDQPLIVPLTDFFGTFYSVVGVQQAWIERLGADPTIPTIPPITGRKGTWYASGGNIIVVCPPGPPVCPGYTIPASGQLSRYASLIHPTDGFPSGHYRFHLEYKPVFAGGIYDVIAAVSLDLIIGDVPDVMLTDLHTAVQGLEPGTSLADKVVMAQAAYSTGDESGTCEILGAFINQVEAQSGKHVDSTVAEQLIADTTAIIDAIGC